MSERQAADVGLVKAIEEVMRAYDAETPGSVLGDWVLFAYADILADGHLEGQTIALHSRRMPFYRVLGLVETGSRALDNRDDDE